MSLNRGRGTPISALCRGGGTPILALYRGREDSILALYGSPQFCLFHLQTCSCSSHVLLGFTKDGRYLISYKLMIDAFYDSPLPQYVYSLHWWEFDQRKPLVQVNTKVYSTVVLEERAVERESGRTSVNFISVIKVWENCLSQE